MAKVLFFLTIFLCRNLLACTLFSINQESHTYVGNNCDTKDPAYGYYFVEPGGKGKHGAIYFGSDRDKQSAINEVGLFYADAAIPHWPLETYPIDTNSCDLRKKLMQECSTVEDAVKLFKKYSTRLFAFVHMLVADRTGKSVVIEWDGEELKFIQKKGNVQVATNFIISKINDEEFISCKRYRNAMALLRTHVVSTETCREALVVTHGDFTLYSLLDDLKSGLIYLFVGHDYEKVCLLNISEELKKGPSVVKISNIPLRPYTIK